MRLTLVDNAGTVLGTWENIEDIHDEDIDGDARIVRSGSPREVTAALEDVIDDVRHDVIALWKQGVR